MTEGTCGHTEFYRKELKRRPDAGLVLFAKRDAVCPQVIRQSSSKIRAAESHEEEMQNR